MARPREFEEQAVLGAALRCFWVRGYEATSVRHLIAEMGLTGPSLYNAFGDKRALYRRCLEHYIDAGILDRIRRFEEHGARSALVGFFSEIVERSLGDPDRKGCMLVNAALDVAPHDPEFRRIVDAVLLQVEGFFLRCVEAGQADGSIGGETAPIDLAHHLLGALLGVRVLARVRPERVLLEAVVGGALACLGRPAGGAGRPRSAERTGGM